MPGARVVKQVKDAGRLNSSPIQPTEDAEMRRPRGSSGGAGIQSQWSGRNPGVDRETARANMSAGLMAAGIATAVFALCFVAAMLYIAS